MINNYEVLYIWKKKVFILYFVYLTGFLEPITAVDWLKSEKKKKKEAFSAFLEYYLLILLFFSFAFWMLRLPFQCFVSYARFMWTQNFVANLCQIREIKEKIRKNKTICPKTKDQLNCAKLDLLSHCLFAFQFWLVLTSPFHLKRKF